MTVRPRDRLRPARLGCGRLRWPPPLAAPSSRFRRARFPGWCTATLTWLGLGCRPNRWIPAQPIQHGVALLRGEFAKSLLHAHLCGLPFQLAHLVHCLVGELDDVEAVAVELCVGQAGCRTSEVGRAHTYEGLGDCRGLATIAAWPGVRISRTRDHTRFGPRSNRLDCLSEAHPLFSRFFGLLSPANPVRRASLDWHSFPACKRSDASRDGTPGPCPTASGRRAAVR